MDIDQRPLEMTVLHSDDSRYLHDALLTFQPDGRGVSITLYDGGEARPYTIPIGHVHELIAYLINHIAERENALFKQVVGHPKPNPTANPREDFPKPS